MTEDTQRVAKFPATTAWSFMRIITAPSVDRAVAIVSIVPFAYLTYLRFAEGVFNIPRVSSMIVGFLLIGTMVVRRAPVRVTTNPWLWLLAFVATYGAVVSSLVAQRGVPLAPAIVTSTIALLALSITVFARLSLGRNIGFVPAQRRLVTSGAYAYMRHPIYTGLIAAIIATAIVLATPVGLTLAVIPAVASAFGVDQKRNGLLLAGTCSALAGVAGVCLALSFTLAPSQIYAWVGVVFAAVMLGGLGRALGPLIAGTVIGVSEAVTMAVTAPAWAPVVSFTLLILLLLLRPGKE
jgi:branched-subunit amino acid ABC-type transport system permease component